MVLDDDIRRYLDSMAAVPRPSEQAVSITELRHANDRAAAAIPAPEREAESRDFTVPGRDGPVPVRHYLPDTAGPQALVIYAHGGGFVFGSPDTHHEIGNRLCLDASVQVLSVDYRLAPEHPFPAGVHDVIDVMLWAAENTATIAADPARLFVAGDSAGGNFAAAAAQAAREMDVELAGQVLIYPVVDQRLIEYESRITRASGYGLTQADMLWYGALYLGDAGHADNPLASPILNPQLSGLAPTFLMTAGFDPLHSEGEEYGRLLAEAGVEVEHLHLPGANHGVFSNYRLFRSGETTWQALLSWLKQRTST